MKKLLKAAMAPLSVLNAWIPKSADRVFFYANLGFRDNVRALYDYMIDAGINERSKIVVATDAFRVLRPGAPHNVRFVSPLRGILPFLRSKFCFYSFGKYPIAPGRGQMVVNLWHGMPLKRIGRMQSGHEYEKQNYFTYILATSPFFAEVMQKSFGAAAHQVLLCNQPRCDALFQKSTLPAQFCGFDKLLLWLPTFRRSERLAQNDGQWEKINPFDPQLLSMLQKLLCEHNALLCLKPHPMACERFPEEQFSNIRFITEESLQAAGISLYALLSHAHALLTDYSSVYFDFLLLDRPIGFVCPDLEDYRQKRGFVVDEPAALMPGPMLETPEQLSAFLADACTGNDLYSKERQRVRAVCCTQQGAGCPGILKAINFNIEEGCI